MYYLNLDEYVKNLEKDGVNKDHIWAIARLDGRGFSKFTKSCAKPFDDMLSACMVDTAAYVLENTLATLAYTQSDEITLVYKMDKFQNFFNGRVDKINSVLAGMCSSKFMHTISYSNNLFDKIPHFDCRLFSAPGLDAASNVIKWRFDDCKRNSISAVAQKYYTQRELNNKNTSELIDMLRKEKNVTYDHYPEEFKYGVFIQKTYEKRELTEIELLEIPEKYRPIGPITRAKLSKYTCDLNKEPYFVQALLLTKTDYENE